MPVDYTATMLEIQRTLIDFYACHDFPNGNNKSTRFENSVFFVYYPAKFELL